MISILTELAAWIWTDCCPHLKNNNNNEGVNKITWLFSQYSPTSAFSLLHTHPITRLYDKDTITMDS